MNSLKIAKIVGFIQIGAVVLGLVVLGFNLTSLVTTNGLLLFFTLGSVTIALISGYGLIKSKRWAIYLYFISALLPIIKYTLGNINNGKSQKLLFNSQALASDFNTIPLLGYFIFALFTLIQIGLSNLLGLILSYYFYKNRNKFLLTSSKNK